MRILPFAALALSAGLFACGGDDPISTVDAARVDAAAGLMGLGQLCDEANPCGAAGTCLIWTANSTQGYCTPVCGPDVVGQFVNNMFNGMLPAGATETCTAAYMGTVGRPACGLAIDIQPEIPQGQNPVPGMDYTIDYACAIVCGTSGTQCPPGLVATDLQTSSGTVCLCTGG